MRNCLCLATFCLVPVFLFAQVNSDTAINRLSNRPLQPPHLHQEDSSFSVIFNSNVAWYSAKDTRIDNFLIKYGYTVPQPMPMAIRLELSVVPFKSKMMYTVNASTIVSPQSISTADFSFGAYYRLFERNFWILGGLALGAHYDRIVLDGNMPESFDSIAKIYNRTLSLHRDGFVAEPAAKAFWYPLKWTRFELGLYAGLAYDLDFNSSWKLGYYNQNGTYTTFKKIKKTSAVHTTQEFGWVITGGLTFCYKFD